MIKNIFLLLSLTLLLGCSKWTSGELARLEEFGPIKVGDKVTSFIASTVTNKTIMHNDPKGEFYIFFINHNLPWMAINEELGIYSKVVTENGGVLIGGSDGKFADSFGLRFKSEKMINGKYRYFFEESLAICTDSNSIIISIYKNVRPKDFKSIVAETLEIKK